MLITIRLYNTNRMTTQHCRGNQEKHESFEQVPFHGKRDLPCAAAAESFHVPPPPRRRRPLPSLQPPSLACLRDHEPALTFADHGKKRPFGTTLPPNHPDTVRVRTVAAGLVAAAHCQIPKKSNRIQRGLRLGKTLGRLRSRDTLSLRVSEGRNRRRNLNEDLTADDNAYPFNQDRVASSHCSNHCCS